MSACGYKRTLWDRASNVCFTPERCYEAEGRGLMLLRLFHQRSEGATFDVLHSLLPPPANSVSMLPLS